MILASITSPDCDLLCFSLHRNFPCGSSYRRTSGKFLRCILCLTLSRYSRRQISLPSSWHMSACWLYHDGKPYSVSRRAVTNGSALSSFMTASTLLLQNAFTIRHKVFADNVPIALDIAISTYDSSIQTVDPIRCSITWTPAALLSSRRDRGISVNREEMER